MESLAPVTVYQFINGIAQSPSGHADRNYSYDCLTAVREGSGNEKTRSLSRYFIFLYFFHAEFIRRCLMMNCSANECVYGTVARSIDANRIIHGVQLEYSGAQLEYNGSPAGIRRRSAGIQRQSSWNTAAHSWHTAVSAGI